MPFKYFGKINYTPYTKVSGFADELHKGRLVGSKCKGCGEETFPPRADCTNCLSGDFEYVNVKPAGTLVTFTTVNSPPAGFEDICPYTLGLIDLDSGGRLISWFENTEQEVIKIGMRVKVIPRIFEEIEDIKFYYAIEAEQ